MPWFLASPLNLTPAHEVVMGLLLICAMSSGAVSLVALALVDRYRARRAGRPPRPAMQRTACLIIIVAALLLLDGLAIEPNYLTVTRVTMPLRRMPPGHTLRIVHLSDIHFVGPRWLHGRVLAQVARERPALILVSGDLLEPASLGGNAVAARRFYTRLAAIAPLVMILGNHDVRPPDPAVQPWLLRNETRDLAVQGVPLRLIGWEERPGDFPPRLPLDAHRINLVLTHTPDWFPEAARQGADLALAGHTHGGQIRLPIWGAVVTASIYGKRFEYGAVQLHEMRAFVTRGISQMTWPIPPMRLFCPPEVVVLTLRAPAAR